MGTDEGNGTPASTRSSNAGVPYDTSFTPKTKTFRARKLDPIKPLSIYKETDLDPEEHTTIMMRSVPLVSTGVDKEEEEEVHLKVILESGATTSSANVHIPIPEAAETTVPYYDTLYPPGSFKLPKQYCKPPAPPRSFSNLISSSISPTISAILTGNTLVGYGFGAKVPLCVPVVTPLTITSNKQSDQHSISSMYNTTNGDRSWIDQLNQLLAPNKKQISYDLFEKTLFMLEALANTYGWENVQSSFLAMPEAIPFIDKLFLENQYKLISSIQNELFSYWKEKRTRANGIPLIPTLKIEDNPKSSILDPYVCFRRRELRTLRKTRRSDALSIEKLRLLKNHFSEVYEMLSMILDRDNLKRELLILENTIFHHTLQLEDWKQTFGISVRSGLIPSTIVISSGKFPIDVRESLITGKKKIRAIVSDPYEGHFMSDHMHDQKPSYPAALFGLRKTYKDLRTVYYRSGVEQDQSFIHEDSNPPSMSLNTWSSSVSPTPTFSTSNPWLYFFHPIEAARLVELDLDLKTKSDQSRPVPPIDFVQNIFSRESDNSITNGNEELLNSFFSRDRSRSKHKHRIGRGGRIIIDRFEPSHKRPAGHIRLVSDMIPDTPSIYIDTIKTLNVQDLSELNNIRIGKYNDHVQSMVCSFIDPSNTLGDWDTASKMMSFPIFRVSMNTMYGSNSNAMSQGNTSNRSGITSNRIGHTNESPKKRDSVNISGNTTKRKKKKPDSDSNVIDLAEGRQKKRTSNNPNETNIVGNGEKKRKRPPKRPNQPASSVSDASALQTDKSSLLIHNSNTKSYIPVINEGITRSLVNGINGGNAAHFPPWINAVSNMPTRPGTMPVAFSKIGGVTVTGVPKIVQSGTIASVNSNNTIIMNAGTMQQSQSQSMHSSANSLSASATHLHTIQNNSLDNRAPPQITVRVRSRSNDNTNVTGVFGSGDNNSEGSSSNVS